MDRLLSDAEIIERVFHHIDNNTTDLGDEVWREPVQNYRCEKRFAAELQMMRRLPMPFCPSAAIRDVGAYVARISAGTPLIVVRGQDRVVRAFRNACRHRGRQLVEGNGCTRSFVCGYHGWAYRLDGKLAKIPHEEGFPQIDKRELGLAEVAVTEKGGIVFVTQEDEISDGALDSLPDMFLEEQFVFDAKDYLQPFNWKLNQEAAMEGYHIKATHSESFYPYGFDNLNVVENFGRNSRITFPFRRIEELRDVPESDRDISGKVTYANVLFPNVLIAVLSRHTAMAVAEPVSPSETHMYTYRLANPGNDGSSEALSEARYDADFVAETGLMEDLATTRSIQAGLDSGANTHFTYGHFEKAIVHFHKTLADQLSRAGFAD